MRNEKRLKILILTKKFGEMFPKHKAKYDFFKSLNKVAKIKYWSEDGNIVNILKKLQFKPDFIFQYDMMSYQFVPKVIGLAQINIPKGAYVIDEYWNPNERKKYFDNNNIDLIFSATKEGFLKRYPEYSEQFRFLPFSINKNIINNWNIVRDIDFLLMGLITKNYPFRKQILDIFGKEEGFIYHSHPGHATQNGNAIINRRYARELNKAKIFFTCGSKYKYPVAKFFEVLGCKTLLLAEPNNDIYELGFKDGENFIACNHSNVRKKAFYYLLNQKERERIALNGYQLVHQYHTNETRAQEFINYINLFLKKTVGIER